jgi:uncharacterized protein (TIGR03083 family)
LLARSECGSSGSGGEFGGGHITCVTGRTYRYLTLQRYVTRIDLKVGDDGRLAMSKATEGLAADRAALLEICAGLGEADWRAPSGCEGWTVQDVVAHMGALFWLVVDRTKLPDVTGLPTERAQDVYVEARRSMTADQVLADYESVSVAALTALDGLDSLDFEIPLGDLGTFKASVVPTAYSFDHYVHIRMDLFEPRGPLNGAPPSDEVRLAPALDWVAAALPQQSADALAELDGSVEFVITGPGARSIEAGSGESLGQVSMTAPAFIQAITQRGDWSEADIKATGDALNPAALARLKVF